LATIEVTKESFKEIVSDTSIVIIDWWAPWCGPCKAFAPIFETASGKHTDVVFAKINTDEQPELAGAFSISSIPTLMVFRERVLLFSQPGMLPPAALDEVLQKIKGLDMNEIRKEIAEQEAKEGGEAQES
jgi:thioredoxin 1